MVIAAVVLVAAVVIAVGFYLAALIAVGKAFEGSTDPAPLPPPTTTRCTGLTARWCPTHGDCTCDPNSSDLDDPTCPLHAPASTHARHHRTLRIVRRT